MPRPRKWRRVCCLPESDRFGPLDASPFGGAQVRMTVDEYETIRLIDLEGFTQEACAVQMKISRTTVQGIYDEARKVLAQALVNGSVLIIGGGDYRLCDDDGPGCGRGCRRHHHEIEDSATVIHCHGQRTEKEDLHEDGDAAGVDPGC